MQRLLEPCFSRALSLASILSTLMASNVVAWCSRRACTVLRGRTAHYSYIHNQHWKTRGAQQGMGEGLP
jgi:hypothetical protein